MSKPSGEKLADLTQSSWRPGVPRTKIHGKFWLVSLRRGLVSGCPRKCPPKKKRDLFWLEVVSCWVNSCEQKSIGVEVDQCIIRLGFYAAAHRQGFRVTQPFLIYEGS